MAVISRILNKGRDGLKLKDGKKKTTKGKNSKRRGYATRGLGIYQKSNKAERSKADSMAERS